MLSRNIFLSDDDLFSDSDHQKMDISVNIDAKWSSQSKCFDFLSENPFIYQCLVEPLESYTINK